MAWEKRKRDHNIMFAVNYDDGRAAYLTISPYPRLFATARKKANSRKGRSPPYGEYVEPKRF